jgi:hypothetical protein
MELSALALYGYPARILPRAVKAGGAGMSIAPLVGDIKQFNSGFFLEVLAEVGPLTWCAVKPEGENAHGKKPESVPPSGRSSTCRRRFCQLKFASGEQALS